MVPRILPLLTVVRLESRSTCNSIPSDFSRLCSIYRCRSLVNCPDLIVISCRSFHHFPVFCVSDSRRLLTIRDQVFFLYFSIISFSFPSNVYFLRLKPRNTKHSIFLFIPRSCKKFQIFKEIFYSKKGKFFVSKILIRKIVPRISFAKTNYSRIIA